jgi:hypothetical protein
VKESGLASDENTTPPVEYKDQAVATESASEAADTPMADVTEPTASAEAAPIELAAPTASIEVDPVTILDAASESVVTANKSPE